MNNYFMFYWGNCLFVFHRQERFLSRFVERKKNSFLQPQLPKTSSMTMGRGRRLRTVGSPRAPGKRGAGMALEMGRRHMGMWFGKRKGGRLKRKGRRKRRRVDKCWRGLARGRETRTRRVGKRDAELNVKCLLLSPADWMSGSEVTATFCHQPTEWVVQSSLLHFVTSRLNEWFRAHCYILSPADWMSGSELTATFCHLTTEWVVQSSLLHFVTCRLNEWFRGHCYILSPADWMSGSELTATFCHQPTEWVVQSSLLHFVTCRLNEWFRGHCYILVGCKYKMCYDHEHSLSNYFNTIPLLNKKFQLQNKSSPQNKKILFCIYLGKCAERDITSIY